MWKEEKKAKKIIAEGVVDEEIFAKDDLNEVNDENMLDADVAMLEVCDYKAQIVLIQPKTSGGAIVAAFAVMRDLAPHISEGTKRWVMNTNKPVEQYVVPRVGPGLTISAAINIINVMKQGIDGANALAKDPADAWHNLKTPTRSNVAATTVQPATRQQRFTIPIKQSIAAIVSYARSLEGRIKGQLSLWKVNEISFCLANWPFILSI